jgi:hypothetical protein
MPTPIFRIEVVSRSTPAVNYLHLGGPTKINFEGTPLMSTGHRATTVESERGVICVSAEFENFVLPREVFWQVIEGERKDTPLDPRRSTGREIQAASRRTRADGRAKEAAGLLGPAPTGIEAVEEIVKETKKDSGAPGHVVVAGILAKDSVPYALNLLEWALGDDSGSTNPCASKRSTGWARRRILQEVPACSRSQVRSTISISGAPPRVSDFV